MRSLLDAQPDLRVVGEAADGVETSKIVERLRPDVLVADMMMGGMNGIEVTRQAKRLSPKTHVVILSMHGDETYVMEALRAGAKAYVLKDSLTEDLLRAIREAALGRRYLSPSLSEHVIDGYLEKSDTAVLKPHERLTIREREVLHLLATGHNNAEIAAKLCISRRTVENHRASMMRRLGLRGSVQLLRYAMEQGIAAPESGHLQFPLPLMGED